MNLDDTSAMTELDQDQMIDHINSLPEQLSTAVKLGMKFPLPEMNAIDRVIIAGMGGSAIGADLLISYLSDKMEVPVFVHRDYGLPAFAKGRQTLVVLSSHSGNTEETLSAFEQANKEHCQIVVICTGGSLYSKAVNAGLPVWKFDHSGQPRTAVGFSFGLLLALFVRLGLVSDQTGNIEKTVELLKSLVSMLNLESLVKNNPAKRLAGQMIGRHVTIFAGGFMAPVARRWKGQLNEIAKTIASFEILPEADHNTLAGLCNPSDVVSQEMALFLQASATHPRNQKRVEITREIIMVEGLNTDLINARGESQMEQMWSMILFGDYTSYYLAMAYGVDPTPVDSIEAFKAMMNDK